MMKKMRKGQTMVEYIIIVCLIAIALIGVFTYVSRAIGAKGAAAASKLDQDEGDKAKNTYESISENSVRELKSN